MQSRLDTSLYILLFAVALATVIGVLIGSGWIDPAVILVAMIIIVSVIWIMSLTASKARVVLLYVSLFILLFHPTIRIVINNIPVYLIDILLGVLLISVIFSRENFLSHTIYARGLFWLILIFWIPSSIFNFFHEVYLTNVWLETFYMLMRTLLSISIYFLIPAGITNKRNLHILLWIMSIAMLLTSILGLMNSFLPIGDPILVFIDSLTPTDLQLFQERYLSTTGTVRARALIGGPNHMGTLLIMCWSIVFGMYISGRFKRHRLTLGIILFISTLGIIVTYTRSVYLGFALIILWYFFKGSGQRGRILFSGAIAVVIGLTVFMSTDLFNFDFITARFASISEAPTTDQGNAARILVYTQMPTFLVNNPQWLLVGRGFASFDLGSRGLLSSSLANSEIFQTTNHNLVIITFYQRGLVSAILLVGIWIAAYRLTQKYALLQPENGEDSYRWLAISLQAALVGMLPAWLFDHFLASTIHMQTIMFMIFGLVITMTWLANRPET